MATEQTLFSATIPVAHVADLLIHVGGKHVYANVSGVKPWQLAIYLDGQLVNYAGGSGAYTDAPYCEASALGVAAGNHTLRITWFGDQSMVLRGVNAIVEMTYK